MNTITNQKLNVYKIKIEEIVRKLHDLTHKIGHKELADTISDLRSRLNEPFLFVIAGEVKAGKSSFINALLDTGEEICKVAPQPMTDTVQQIIYGEKEEIIEINPHLKKILLPVEILKEIAIVDTPGTNTIAEYHQEITERFIPGSDLIVFVFEAKNPYRQSAWDFFDFIHDEWRKKIIFVLQQKDLLPDESLQVNINGVKENAIKKGIESPIVFAVSALDELEGRKEISGFIEIRKFISENITGGKAPLLKQRNNITTAGNILTKISSGLQLRREQWKSDTVFRNDIKETLSEHQNRSESQVDNLVKNLLTAYDNSTLKGEQELSNGLRFFTLLKRSVGSIFSKKTSANDWLTGIASNLETDLNQKMKIKLNEGVVDIADSIQQMARVIDLKIKTSDTILKDDHEIFSDIAAKRANVLEELKNTFAQFLNEADNFKGSDLFGEKNIAPNVATGSGLALVGVILTTVTNTAVFDITGGLLTAVGLVFAGVSVGFQRRKIISGYNDEIKKGRTKLKNEITTKLKTYIADIKNRIDKNFNKFDQLIDFEKEQLDELETSHDKIHQEIITLKEELS